MWACRTRLPAGLRRLRCARVNQHRFRRQTTLRAETHTFHRRRATTRTIARKNHSHRKLRFFPVIKTKTALLADYCSTVTLTSYDTAHTSPIAYDTLLICQTLLSHPGCHSERSEESLARVRFFASLRMTALFIIHVLSDARWLSIYLRARSHALRRRVVPG